MRICRLSATMLPLEQCQIYCCSIENTKEHELYPWCWETWPHHMLDMTSCWKDTCLVRCCKLWFMTLSGSMASLGHCAPTWSLCVSGKWTISQKLKVLSPCLSPTPCQGIDGVNIILSQQARRKVIMHTVVDMVHSLVWGCLIAWNQHFNVCQSLFLTETLLCCFTNHCGTMHRALSRGKTWKGTAKGKAKGRVSVHCLRHQVSCLLEKINHVESSEALLAFLSPRDQTTALCPWLSGLQGDPSVAPCSLHSSGRHAHCPRPPSRVSSWAAASFRNAITI